MKSGTYPASGRLNKDLICSFFFADPLRSKGGTPESHIMILKDKSQIQIS